MKQFVNLLLMTIVGVSALNGQEWRFNDWRYNGKILMPLQSSGIVADIL